MQYSVTTTEKNGILQECERNCKKNTGDITGSTTLLADFTNYTNRAMRQIWSWIFDAYGGWQYDDGNQTDLPSSTSSLESGKVTYALPSDVLTVRGVEIKDEGNVWHILTPLTSEHIQDVESLGEFEKTASTPRYYRLVGQTIYLYPASNFSQASSLKIFYDRGSVAFVTTDTTKTPGFASEYHDLVPLLASIEWLKIHLPEWTGLAIMKNDVELKKREIKKYYNKRFNQMFPPRITTKDTLKQYE